MAKIRTTQDGKGEMGHGCAIVARVWGDGYLFLCFFCVFSAVSCSVKILRHRFFVALFQNGKEYPRPERERVFYTF